jgi:integrase
MQSHKVVEVTSSPTVTQKTPKYQFNKVKDGRGHPISGLWERNGRYYLQVTLPNKGCTKVPLVDDQKEPVRTVLEAVAAVAKLREKIQHGELPVAGRRQAFSDYAEHYLKQIKTLEAKKPKTIAHEKSILKGWKSFLGDLPLNKILRTHVSGYIQQRKASKLNNRTVNLDVLTLNNLLKFARREGVLSGKLPTEGWERLPYKAPKRELYTKDEIETIRATAVSINEDGSPRFRNGELLSDVLRFLLYTGARITSALATRWSDVSLERKQVALTKTKYDKQDIVVDFNPELEAHLRDMHSRREPESDFLFPGTRSDGSVGSVRKSLELVRTQAGFPDFGFHDCRHTFISYCIMSGVDILTVAKWVGHSDGGVLIGKVYGHLASEHRQRAAKKVSFEHDQPTPSTDGNLVDLSQLSPEVLLQALLRLQKGKQEPLKNQ